MPQGGRFTTMTVRDIYPEHLSLKELYSVAADDVLELL